MGKPASKPGAAISLPEILNDQMSLEQWDPWIRLIERLGVPVAGAFIGFFGSIATLIWKTIDRKAGETERREIARVESARRDREKRHELYSKAMAACAARSLHFSKYRANPSHQGLADEQHRLGVAEAEAVEAAVLLCSEPVRKKLNTFVNHYRSQPHRRDDRADREWWDRVIVARLELEEAMRAELAE